MQPGNNFDSSRAELFEALGHPMRVKILRSLEDGPAGFAKLKRAVGIESSGQMQFHLGKLGGLVTTNSEGSYALTDEGKEAIRVFNTATVDAAASRADRRHAQPNGWMGSKRPFQVASVVMLVLIVISGSAYYSQSMQVGSLNTQVSSLNSEVLALQSQVNSTTSQLAHLQSIMNIWQQETLANSLAVSSVCTSPHTILGSEIVVFQANYSGYLIVTARDFVNNSEALPVLQLSDSPSHSLPLSTGVSGIYGSIMGIYPIPLSATSAPISFSIALPVSPPGYVILSLVPVAPFGQCVTGANASGTFSVAYYY